MPGWSELFGEGASAQQFLLWGVGYALAQSLLGPLLQELTKSIMDAAQVDAGDTSINPMTPADLADWVVRGIIDSQTAKQAGRQSGVGPLDMQRMIDNAGEPPGLTFVLEAYRRGFIEWADSGVGSPSVERAIKTGRIYDYWSDVINKMREAPISAADAVNAVLRGQIPHADGQTIAYQNGISAESFQTLLNSAGRPPSPSELIEFYRRGLIPFKGVGPDALTFQQGIYEGDSKDKWEPLYEKLVKYVPPPRTITALERSGAVTPDQAARMYQEAGLTTEDAAIYAKSALGEKLAGTKQLAQTTILTLYETQAIDTPTAETMLGKLGYDSAEIAFVLELTDLQREIKIVNSSITRVGTLYVNHKITRTAAANALGELKVAGAHAEHILGTWDIERSANVRLPTPAQIIDAAYYNIFTTDQAIAELTALGYTARDAWMLISVRFHGKQPGEPTQAAGAPGTV